jgi:hypothetical protein
MARINKRNYLCKILCLRLKPNSVNRQTPEKDNALEDYN